MRQLFYWEIFLENKHYYTYLRYSVKSLPKFTMRKVDVMLLMLIFDLFAMVISGIFLKYSCKMDLFQLFCNMIDEYWMVFMVKLPIIVMFFAVRDVNFGFDYSGKYSWITDEGRFKIICNSSHISEEEKSLLLGNSTLC